MKLYYRVEYRELDSTRLIPFELKIQV